MQRGQADYEGIVQTIREKIHILDLLRDDLPNAPKANGSICTLKSPFRKDANPSLVIYSAENRWFDFGIGKGGDVIDWLTTNKDMTFRTALYQLAKRAGLDVPSGALSKSFSERLLIEQAYKQAQSYFLQRLTPAHRQWLADRYGFNDSDIARFGFGYDDGDLYYYLKDRMEDYEKKNIQPIGASPIATGLFIYKGGDIFDSLRGRITIPTYEKGTITSFVGRAFNKGVRPKYACLPNRSTKHPYISPIVQKDYVVGIDSVGDNPALFCTEGMMDCFAVLKQSIPCISPSGLTFAPRAREKALKAVSGRQVIVCYDKERSKAGARGAIQTADFLSQTASEVLIADLPDIDGIEKVDLAEYLKRQGTNGECFSSLITLMATAKTFVPSKKWDKERVNFREETPSQKNGEIDLFIDAKEKVYKKGDGTKVSTFILICKEIRTTEDGDDIFVVDMFLYNKVYENLFFPAVIFSDVKKFEEAVGRKADASWTGRKHDLLALKRLLSDSGAPRVKSVSVMGLYERDDFLYWVSPTDTIPQDGAPPINDVKFTQSGKHVSTDQLDFDLHSVINYDESKVDLGKLQEALRLLPTVNDPSFIHPAIAWFLAAPLKLKFLGLVGGSGKKSMKLSGFPILWVYGSPASGKSYTMEHALLPLLGVKIDGHFSAGSTPYPRMVLLSSTNAIPIVLDEYRRENSNSAYLHQHLRTIYRTGVDARGTKTGAVRKFLLQAPVCVCGEDLPNDQALFQRSVLLQAFKTHIANNGKYHGAINDIHELDLFEQAPFILKFLMNRDIDMTIGAAGSILMSHPDSKHLGMRARHNALAVLCGSIWYRELCEELGIFDVELDNSAILSTLIEKGDAPLISEEYSSLDMFFEGLSSMINDERSPISYGRHYKIQPRRGNLIFSLTDTHAIYRRWNREKNSACMTISSLKALIKDSEASEEGYMIGSTKAKLGGKTKHVYVVDLEKLNDIVPAADELLRENLMRLEEQHQEG